VSEGDCNAYFVVPVLHRFAACLGPKGGRSPLSGPWAAGSVLAMKRTCCVLLPDPSRQTLTLSCLVARLLAAVGSGASVCFDSARDGLRSFPGGRAEVPEDLLPGKRVPQAHPPQGDPVQDGQGLALCTGEAPLRSEAERVRWSD